MKTLGFGRSKSTTLGFWTHQDQQSCVGTWFCGSRIAPGPANLCWYRRCGTRASKPVLVHTKFKVAFGVAVKIRFWIPGQTLNDLQSSVLLSAIATSDI